MSEIAKPSDNPIKKYLIRVDNPDIPIYRIFPLWFFEEALRLRQLVLVSPKLWEDPYEIIGDAIAVDFEQGERIVQEIINQSLPPVFAQCWSTTAESDTLLRAYSRVVKDPHFGRNMYPRHEGVRVRTTPRKLLKAMTEVPQTLSGDWFLGSVMYLTQDQVLQDITNGIDEYRRNTGRLDMFSNPKNRAKLLLMKRDAFSHEAEFRVIFISRAPTTSDEKLLRLPIDPNSVFEEVSFDPRLEPFEKTEREDLIKKLGFKGQITDTGLYQRTLLLVSLLGRT